MPDPTLPLRSFALATLARYAHHHGVDSAPYMRDLAGGFVHPALDVSDRWTVIVSSDCGEPLDDDVGPDADPGWLRFLIGVDPRTKADYDDDAWVEMSVAATLDTLADTLASFIQALPR